MAKKSGKIADDMEKVLLANVKENPETEKEFMDAFIFWGRIQLAGASGALTCHPLGIPSYDEKFQEDEIIKHWHPGIMIIIANHVMAACERFSLACPGMELGMPDRKPFKKWFDEVAMKLGKEARYSRMVFHEWSPKDETDSGEED